eukprot:TRINITY_DN5332_c3_g2_i1.p1 TRINITY_DN5332_c3_g2~~TRINITY_DN5332_c3_g2_i1.p1  ORF type:complete len:576 (+),score=104.14 TRINITY_DN5332_c3_g2_i1:48-1730(+)
MAAMGGDNGSFASDSEDEGMDSLDDASPQADVRTRATSSDDDDYGVPGGRPRLGPRASLAEMITSQSQDLAQREQSYCEYVERMEHFASPSPKGASAPAAPAAPAEPDLCRPMAAGEFCKPGRLYAWGKAGGKGGNALPVPEAFVDAAGDCVYPAPVQFPGCKAGREPRFVRASADQGMFSALSRDGELWGWTSGRRRGPIPQLPPQKLLAGVADCSVGAGFIVAVMDDRSVVLAGAPRQPLPNTDAWSKLQWDDPDGGGAVAIDACANVVGVVQGDGALWTAGSGPAVGFSEPKEKLSRVPGLPPIHNFSIGSIHGAACGRDGSLWVWGDGLSANLGLGGRKNVVSPVQVSMSSLVRGVGCTRGQQMPKRVGTRQGFKPGQEGPRCHAMTEDGKLWIAGTTHKGLGANCLSKTLQPSEDHTEFYCVGGKAGDVGATAVYTGAAEDLRTDPPLAHRRMAAVEGTYGGGGMTGYLAEAKIVSSTPCHIHSVALSSDGRAFAWGCGSDGRTGLRAYMRGPGGSKRTLKCYVSTPSHIEALEGKRVLSVTAGRWWSLAIVDDR